MGCCPLCGSTSFSPLQTSSQWLSEETVLAWLMRSVSKDIDIVHLERWMRLGYLEVKRMADSTFISGASVVRLVKQFDEAAPDDVAQQVLDRATVGRVLTPTDAQRMLYQATGIRIARSTFSRWVSDGRIYATKVGSRYFIPYLTVCLLIRDIRSQMLRDVKTDMDHNVLVGKDANGVKRCKLSVN